MISLAGTVLLTHEQFEALSHRIAAALLADGLDVGDRVAVFSPNDPLAFACVSGIIRAGGVWTAVNAASREQELADFLVTSGCTRLFFHASLADRAEQLLKRVAGISAVSIGASTTEHPDLTAWMAPAGAKVPVPAYDSTAVAMMIGTGGTTGRPKGVPLTHRQFHLMCVGFNTHLPEADPPRYLCATPMTHAAGAAAFPVLAEGGSVVIHQGVQPRRSLPRLSGTG